MAYLSHRFRNGKKRYFIVWYDWSKDETKYLARREVSCKKSGATNAEDRKKLLKKYQEREDKLLKHIEVFGDTENLDRPLTQIKGLVKEYLEERKRKVEIRNEHGGRQGISGKTYWENQNSLKILLEFCDKNEIKQCKFFTPEKSQKFRSWLENQGRNPHTNNKIMRSIKQFFKNYEDYRPVYFEDASLVTKKLKSFKTEYNLPREITIDELSTLILTENALDSECCRSTEEN